MNPTAIGLLVFVSVFVAALLGMLLRALLPKDHLSAETKDIVRLAMGLVATMTALVLGLLVASAKGSYDTQKAGVTEMAAKAIFLDRVLALYGPETAQARTVVREAVASALARVWPEKGSAPPQLSPNLARGAALYEAIQKLSPQTDAQRAFRSQAIATAIDLGQMQWLQFERTGTSISTVLLVVVIFWLAILFLSFGLFAPANPTVIVALVVGALSVSAALFLVLELDRPYGGLIQIPNEPLVKALKYIGQ